MLKPQASETRELINLDGLFRFRVDFDRAGHREEWFKARLETQLEMGVPASYNDVFPDKAIRDHVGYVWYQREVRVPRGWAGERPASCFPSMSATKPASVPTARQVLRTADCTWAVTQARNGPCTQGSEECL